MKRSIYHSPKCWIAKREQAGVIGNESDRIRWGLPVNGKMVSNALLQNDGQTEFEYGTPWHLPRYTDSVMTNSVLQDFWFCSYFIYCHRFSNSFHIIQVHSLLTSSVAPATHWNLEISNFPMHPSLPYSRAALCFSSLHWSNGAAFAG